MLIDKADMQLLEGVGLNASVISGHQRNILKSIQNQSSQTFEIISTCRRETSTVLRCLDNAQFKANHFVSFVPAAGASSRWLSPLSRLINAFSEKSKDLITKSLEELMEGGVLEYPIPRTLRDFIQRWHESGAVPTQESYDALLLDIESPKAFYPAVLDGASFLDLKFLENDSIPGLQSGAFVCPLDRSAQFQAAANKSPYLGDVSYKIYEQGSTLATVRFTSEGRLLLDDKGLPSPVPAGHGALLKVLPQLKIDFPTAHSAWIRNIDNVVGTSSEVIAATTRFLATHEAILTAVKNIRGAFGKGDLDLANREAVLLLELWPEIVSRASNLDPIQVVAESMFHAEPSGHLNLPDLKQIFSRKVVTMGQVPNTAMDVGGTAVFAKVAGKMQKLCIELPHASLADRKKFLEDPKLATHFNPVFVAVELPTEQETTAWNNHPFWLIAKKTYRDRPVFYQESILYEMIGSSAYTNLVFVEIPRLLFNPHKSLPDAQRRYLTHWTTSSKR